MSDHDGFWRAVWDYFRIESSTPPTGVLGRRDMPGAEWFPGARLNFAQHVLRQARPGADAVRFTGESGPLRSWRWEELSGQVGALAARLREWGVRPGDRVVGYLPNVPQAMVALLASASVGAIWAACAPDFGARGALDRFGQLDPKVLIHADGYTYGGVWRDRRREVRAIIDGLPGVEQVIDLADWPAGPAATPREIEV